jgi:hypothetical protein
MTTIATDTSSRVITQILVELPWNMMGGVVLFFC